MPPKPYSPYSLVSQAASKKSALIAAITRALFIVSSSLRKAARGEGFRAVVRQPKGSCSACFGLASPASPELRSVGAELKPGSLIAG
jgi:hypothetical protein